jgi:hypothetical protein
LQQLLLNFALVRAFWSRESQYVSTAAIASDSLGVMALVNQLSQKSSLVKPCRQVAEFNAPAKLVTFHKIHAREKIKELH